jgi:hypothetical protein
MSATTRVRTTRSTRDTAKMRLIRRWISGSLGSRSAVSFPSRSDSGPRNPAPGGDRGRDTGETEHDPGVGEVPGADRNDPHPEDQHGDRRRRDQPLAEIPDVLGGGGQTRRVTLRHHLHREGLRVDRAPHPRDRREDVEELQRVVVPGRDGHHRSPFGRFAVSQRRSPAGGKRLRRGVAGVVPPEAGCEQPKHADPDDRDEPARHDRDRGGREGRDHAGLDVAE